MISTRILEAAIEVLVLDTQLTRELGRHIVEKSARLALAQRPGADNQSDPGEPGNPEPGPDADAFLHCIANELHLRGVPADAVDAVVTDLNELYNGLTQWPRDH